MKKYTLFDNSGQAIEQTETPYTEQEILALIEQVYEQRLNGGMTVNGLTVKTHAKSRGLIAGAVSRALIDNDLTKTYKYFPPGESSIELSNAQFIAIGQAIAAHVQKCLEVKETIQTNLANYEDPDEIKTAFDNGMNG